MSTGWKVTIILIIIGVMALTAWFIIRKRKLEKLGSEVQLPTAYHSRVSTASSSMGVPRYTLETSATDVSQIHEVPLRFK